MTLGEAVARVIAAGRAAGEFVPGAAPPERVAAVRGALAREFGAALPDGYAAVLALGDGLDHDGLVLYGSTSHPDVPWQDLVGMNRLWREAPGRDDVLVLGETDLDLFVVSLDGTAPRLLDKVGGDVTEVFPDVDAALVRLLTARL